MRVDFFDFDLPERLIALRPVRPRDHARLLRVSDDRLLDTRFDALGEFLNNRDVVVFNDTKVIPAHLSGMRGAARIEATLLTRDGHDSWSALVKGARKLKIGDDVRFGEGLDAVVTARGEAGEVGFRFKLTGADLDRRIAAVGRMPLPPYIASRRSPDTADETDYQTVFAAEKGAVAAPTAGLHFTDAVLAGLKERGIGLVRVTLHVGAGTFLPVKVGDTANHKMHAEFGIVSADAVDAINHAIAAGGRVLAVGTTSLRLLESAATGPGKLAPFEGETRLFITPGYRFQIVDRLLTNFHLPKSTLIMLVAAFGGIEGMRAAYAHAIAEGYRFYSYGDCMLLDRVAPDESDEVQL